MEQNKDGLPLITLTAGEILAEKEEKAVSVTPDTTVHDALGLMLEKGIGSVLVMEEGEVRGIWTERDLMKNSVTEGFDPKTARIADYMSTDLHYASTADPISRLLDKFLGLRIRRLLIREEGKFVGLLSAGEVVRAGLTARSRQLRELNTTVSWEFYEDWKWRKRRKE